MTAGAAVNAADLTAAAYSRRPPRYPVITATAGLALVLLVNRNTSPGRAVWLADPEVSDALCIPAEAFARALDGRPAPDRWRGGALASLRSLAPPALHEDTQAWPYGRSGPVLRFWLADAEDTGRPDYRPGPARAVLLRQLAGHPRLETAWDALTAALHDQRTRCFARLCGWSSGHESPYQTRLLREQLMSGAPLRASGPGRRT